MHILFANVAFFKKDLVIQALLFLHKHSEHLLSRSYRILGCPFLSLQCQYFVCVHCVVSLVSARWLVLFPCLSIALLLSLCVFVLSVTASYSSSSPFKSNYSLFFIYHCAWSFLPECWFHLLFFVIHGCTFRIQSVHSDCVSASCFIFALSFGLSECCCPLLITWHHQGVTFLIDRFLTCSYRSLGCLLEVYLVATGDYSGIQVVWLPVGLVFLYSFVYFDAF